MHAKRWNHSFHYQKINKYKWKYQGNIPVGKFPHPSVNFRGNLPTEIFPRYIPRDLPWEKKLKQSKKKWWHVIFYQRNYRWNFFVGNSVGKSVDKLWTLFIMSITKGIIDGIFRRYFPESSRIVHLPIALLIVVIYGQNHWRTENASVLFGGFLKKFNWFKIFI